MDDILFSLNAVLPLLLLIAVGYIVRRLNVVNDAFLEVGNHFVFRIAMPILLCRNIYQTDFLKAFDPVLAGFVVASIFALALLTALIAPRFVKNRQSIGTIIQAVYRGNFILFGLPLAINLFGAAGAAPTAMLFAVTIPTYNLLAVFVLTIYSPEYDHRPGSLLKNMGPVVLGILKNPLIIGSAAGFLLAIMPFDMPLFLDKTFADIGGIATPLALIILGAQFNFGQLQGHLRVATITSMVRLILVPAVFVFIAVLIGFRGPKLGAIYILMAAPTAVSSYIMAKDMNSDYVLAGQLVVLTTVLCGFTLFAGIYLLRVLSLI